jgi:Zn finger protein HypA/HybF involved in hydrogenase expression
MNTTEPELTPHTCQDYGKTYHTLSGSRVYCPKCRKWIKSDTRTPDTGGQGPDTGKPEPIHAETNREFEPEPARAKPYYSCQRCGEAFRANSNREKYCKKCKPVIKREQGRTRIQKFRSRIVPCNALDTI